MTRRVPPIACLALLGCSTVLWETGLPWARADFTVRSVSSRGPYLDVSVESGSIARRFFSPDDPACRALLTPGTRVTLGSAGGYGPFRSGDRECPIVGIGDLEDFRRSRSQGGYGQSPIQRGNDRIEIVYRDEEYLFARGGFSIAAMFGWAPGTDQVIGLLPRIRECRPLEQGGPVSILYREAGTPALAIPAEDELCPVRGVIATEEGQFDGVREQGGP